MRIGVLDQTCVGWSGGASYTRALLTSLALAHDGGRNNTETILFLERKGKIEVPKQFQRMAFSSFVSEQNDQHDVVIPVRDKVVKDISAAMIGWLPDFQHYRLQN